ncbi:MAG: choice-of-anchor Q domain-containing protein [Acidimicrobiales bacterium]
MPSAVAATVPCQASSLASAISAANGSSGPTTVTLTANCTYTLSSAGNTTDGGTALPVITGDVTVQGNGSTIARSTASGVGDFRVFDIASGGTLVLDAVTLADGLADDPSEGGGAAFNHGNLSVESSTFLDNASPSPTGTSGGAIDNAGTLQIDTSTFRGNSAQEGGAVFNQKQATITNSTFTDNQALIYGGGAVLNAAGSATLSDDTFVGNTGPGGGAIDNDTTLKISDSTFFDNTGGSNGGGAVQNFGTTTITQSTLSGNVSPYGANILNYTGFSLAISMSIVADGGQGQNCDASAPITDGGYNIDSGSSCGFSASNHSLVDTEPDLDPIASNGGFTETMALQPNSPAVNAIPPSTSGCSGTTDQRGIGRPQGAGCDMGAYEVEVTSGAPAPPTPSGLTATTVTSSSVSLSWSASSGATGYTIYRGGIQIGTTGGATTYSDSTVQPSTSYQYTVDAFNTTGHSSQSSPALSVTTPAAPAGIHDIQGASVSTGTLVSSVTLQLSQPVAAGDLLVGWFGQYSSPGQVEVSDNVNGAWTRTSASTTFSNGGGDLAIFYMQNTKAAPSGLTITISTSSPTYLQGTVSEFSGVATSGALDLTTASQGNSTSVNSGATAAVGAGELVVGGIVTGGNPGSATPGSSAGQAFAMSTQTSSGSADLEYILSSAAGAQSATATLASATDWYSAVAVFRAA